MLEEEKHCYYLWLDGQFVSIPLQSTGYIIPPNGCLLVDNNEIRIDVSSLHLPATLHSLTVGKRKRFTQVDCFS